MTRPNPISAIGDAGSADITPVTPTGTGTDLDHANAEIHDTTDGMSGEDGELLPPPELPAEYLDPARLSLAETDSYREHLSEHWGF